ncbi:hypothetical protein PS6_009121 [Mucor atramentarius]
MSKKNTAKERATELNKKPKFNQGFSSFDSFTSSPFNQSQKSNATAEDVLLSTQESSFELLPSTQNSNAWSEAISEIGDFDMAPFTFDLDHTTSNNNATQTDSVVSNFSDISQPTFPPESTDFNDIQTSTRPPSVHSFVSNLESPIMSQDLVLPFEEDDDAAESIKSNFSTQEAFPPFAENDVELTPPPSSTDNINDTHLPPISDFQFVIPTPTVIKQAPKPVTQLLKPAGITSVALKVILQETEMHEKWENAMNAQLAKHGNIAKMCTAEDSEAALFWILDSWIEGNVIFAWCTYMDEDDIDQWISAKEEDEKKEEAIDPSMALIPNTDTITTTDNYAIKSYPDQKLLNNMNGMPGEKYLFAFSLAYIKSRKYAKKFIEEERVVAVWPEEWSELQIMLPIVGHCIAILTSKFKADSIY